MDSVILYELTVSIARMHERQSKRHTTIVRSCRCCDVGRVIRRKKMTMKT